MEEHVYKAIVESAFEELIGALDRAERRNTMWNEKGGLWNRILQVTSEELPREIYTRLLCRPRADHSRLRKTMFKVSHRFLRLFTGDARAFRLLEKCLWKQWVPEWHNIAFENRLVAVPVIYGIAVEPRIAPRWKFRILVQRFALQVFDQSPIPIGPRESRERRAKSDAISYAVSKVLGLESMQFTVWCIQQVSVDAEDIRMARTGLKEFCCELLAEMFNEKEKALLQLCSEYGRTESCNSGSPDIVALIKARK